MKIIIRVKSDGKLSGKIPVKRGVRQGDLVSPPLFDLVTNEIKNIKDKEGFRMSDKLT
jgi:hypothetical protein